METAATKALIVKTLQEAFDECVKDWNLNELEHKNLALALFGPETVERLFNVTHVAGMYSDEGKILIHATLKGHTVPNDEKPIKLTMELGNTHNNRMKLANIGYPIVDIFALPETEDDKRAKADEEDESPNQMDIENFVEELEETPNFDEEEEAGELVEA